MENNIIVLRDLDQSKETTGRLTAVNDDNEHISFVTLERPWLDNKQGISCIPLGIYPWKKVPATTHIPYEHIAIYNVPNRSGVCIHIFNYYTQSEGCTGVGLDYKDLNGDCLKDLVSSKIAFDNLMAFLPDSGNIEYKNLKYTV